MEKNAKNNTSTSESESSSSDESFTMDESFSGAELDTTRQFTLRDQILKSKSGKTSKFVRVETRESKRIDHRGWFLPKNEHLNGSSQMNLSNAVGPRVSNLTRPFSLSTALSMPSRSARLNLAMTSAPSQNILHEFGLHGMNVVQSKSPIASSHVLSPPTVNVSDAQGIMQRQQLPSFQVTLASSSKITTISSQSMLNGFGTQSSNVAQLQPPPIVGSQASVMTSQNVLDGFGTQSSNVAQLQPLPIVGSQARVMTSQNVFNGSGTQSSDVAWLQPLPNDGFQVMPNPSNQNDAQNFLDHNVCLADPFLGFGTSFLPSFDLGLSTNTLDKFFAEDEQTADKSMDIKPISVPKNIQSMDSNEMIEISDDDISQPLAIKREKRTKDDINAEIAFLQSQIEKLQKHVTHSNESEQSFFPAVCSTMVNDMDENKENEAQ